jgi:GNAT superfamily N-acetyltransferase
MRGLLQRIEDLARLLMMGRGGRVWGAVRHRLYSNSTSIGLRRDLTEPFAAPGAKVPIHVRALAPADDLSCLDVRQSGLTDADVVERLGQLRLVQSGLRTCYVAIAPDGIPCYMQWLILADESEHVQAFFGNLYPRLRADEALLEGAYTPQAYRGLGIMAAAMAQIAARAAELGVRWVITFVDESYAPARKGCERAGFRPYVQRVETYRFLRRRVAFIPLTPAPSGPGEGLAVPSVR